MMEFLSSHASHSDRVVQRHSRRRRPCSPPGPVR